MQKEVKEKSRLAIVTAVQLPNVNDLEFEASLSELRELAKTLGYEVVKTFVQKRTGFDMRAYLGAGKRQEIRNFVNNESESRYIEALNNCKVVVCSQFIVYLNQILPCFALYYKNNQILICTKNFMKN